MMVIKAQVLATSTNEVLMERIFTEEQWLDKSQPLSVGAVMAALEVYIVGEALQQISEIRLRARLV